MNPKFRRIAFFLLIAILVSVFIYSAYQLGRYLVESLTTRDAYGDLSQLVDTHRGERPQITTTAPGGADSPQGTVPGETPAPTLPSTQTLTHPRTGETMEVLLEYATVFQKNPDMVGWISIPGTMIDYPVMQTPWEQDYYLYRDFDKNYNRHGCIYAREQCDINEPSDNITIYGHRMGDGSMFAQLVEYTNQEFFEQNRYIYFDTLTERHTYEIFSVFTTSATPGKGFSYHLFVDASSQAEFDWFVSVCKANSVLDTGVTPVYGDKLITLSTCEYSQENGRLVVVAKRVA